MAVMKLMLRLCLAALLAAPAASAGGFDGYRDRDPPGVDFLAPMVLRLENGAGFRPVRLMVLEPGGTVSQPIPNLAHQRDEDRLPLGFLPVIGGVFEPTANGEFQGAPPIGAAWRAGDALVIGSIETGAALTEGVRRVVVANRGVSFDLPAAFSTEGAPAGEVPPLGDRLLIGRVYRAGYALLVVVDPSLVDPAG